MRPFEFKTFFLVLALFLFSYETVSAVPLDAVEKRALEDRQELMRGGSSQTVRQTHFRSENGKKIRGRRVIKVSSEQETPVSPVSPVRSLRLKTPPEPAPVRVPDSEDEFLVDVDKPRPFAVKPPASDSRLVFDAGAVDSTDIKYVRSTSFNVGVGYKMTEKAMLGLEAKRELNDPWDAEYSGRAPEEDQSMNVRYKLQF